MKRIALSAVIVAAAVSFACGCSKSESPTTPEAAVATNAAAPVTVMEAVKSTVTTTITDASAKLVAQAKTAADTQLAPLATELTSKVQALSSSAGTNEAVKTSLGNAMKSLAEGQDAGALTTTFQLVEALKLTPEQMTMAKEVGNLASAYVVQKNFSTLEGSQSDVAVIVKSLRNGELAAAVPPLKNVATNAKLTDSQKRLITTVADKYAPGWQKLQGAVDAIKKLPGLGN